MLTVGNSFPAFNLQAVVSNDIDKAFTTITSDTDSGKWKVFFFWPKDFTFICPTEIIAFGEMNGAFEALNAKLYGVSTDSEFVHLAWRRDHPGLKTLACPMISDIKRELSEALGILHQDEGVCLRATFIVDPDNIIRHASVNDLSVGRNPQEFLRILEATKTGELCPCNWEKGQDFVAAS